MAMDINVYGKYLEVMLWDTRIATRHVAMIVAIVVLSTATEFRDPIAISRSKVMKLAHINSVVTYHRCLKELQEYGYIRYFPSYHPALGSYIVPKLPSLEIMRQYVLNEKSR